LHSHHPKPDFIFDVDLDGFAAAVIEASATTPVTSISGPTGVRPAVR
jgi:hypothetical protein